MKKIIALIVILISIIVLVFLPDIKKPTEYSVVYYTGGGSEIKTMTVPYNEIVYPPKDPKRKHSTFRGWYTTKTFDEGTEYYFDEKITKSITLYAKWENLPFTISYDLGPGFWPSEEIEDKYVKEFTFDSAMVFVKLSNANSPKHPDGVIRMFTGWRTIPQNEYNLLTKEEKENYPYYEIIKPEEDNEIFDEENHVTLYAYYRGL